MMKHVSRLLVLSLLCAASCALLTGCGSGGSSPAGMSRVGSARFTVQWPAPTRVIPSTSNSVLFSVMSGSSTQPLAGIVLDRPQAPPWTTTASLSNLPAGDLTVSAAAYPLIGAQGIAQAAASAPLVIQPNQVTALTLTLVSSITKIVVTPSPVPTLSPGQTIVLTATPQDANGNIVTVDPNNLQWLSDNPGVASVDTTGPQVTVLANAPGTANITVTESDSGQQTTVVVTVQ